MKKALVHLTAAIIFNICLVLAMPVYAATFSRVYTHDSWDIKERTVAGTVFTAGSYHNGTWNLYADYRGKTILLSTAFEGGNVISDGKTVYYAAKYAGRWYAYRGNVRTGKSKRIAKLANGSSPISLEGYYNGNLYYVMDVPEGVFKSVNLSTKKIRSLRQFVSGSDWVGRYFVLYDGTGAGYSYIDAFDSRTGKLRTIVKDPHTWKTAGKYVYYLDITEGDAGYLYSGRDVTANIKRYTLSNGKRKKLIKNISIKKILEFDSRHIKYVDRDNAVKTKRW